MDTDIRSRSLLIQAECIWGIWCIGDIGGTGHTNLSVKACIVDRGVYRWSVYRWKGCIGVYRKTRCSCIMSSIYTSFIYTSFIRIYHMHEWYILYMFFHLHIIPLTTHHPRVYTKNLLFLRSYAPTLIHSYTHTLIYLYTPTLLHSYSSYILSVHLSLPFLSGLCSPCCIINAIPSVYIVYSVKCKV